MADLKLVYTAPTEETALNELELFKDKWDSKYPKIYATCKNSLFQAGFIDMPKNSCIMQIWAEAGKSALPICNYSQILYQFLTFTQN